LRRVEDGELGFLAFDFAVEVDESQKGAHEVVEGVEVVELGGKVSEIVMNVVVGGRGGLPSISRMAGSESKAQGHHRRRPEFR
jgi:hypothetical protein